jgi:predicted amidohydrolase YtcJ
MYHSFGTTSVFEGHGVATELLNAYKEVHRAGDLTMRSTLAISPNWKAAGNAPFGALIEGWGGWLAEPGLGDAWLKVSGLFVAVGRSDADNVRGAAAPYTGWAGFNSDAGLSREQLKEVLLHCARNDIRVAAIAGGAGLGMLDLYEEVDSQIPLKGRRWVLAHVYVVSPRDIERIAGMGLVLTTHTNASLYKFLDATADRLPPERHDEITPMNQTVLRRDFKSQRVVGAKQALSRMEAMRCATANGAYLTFDEDKKGTLEPGKLADLAVLSADPLTVEAPKIGEIVSQMTMVGGKIVHETPNWSR